MWQCSHCGQQVDDDFRVCWNCNHKRDADAIVIDDPSDDTEPGGPPPELQFTGPMTRHELAAIICKTLALLMFAYATYLSFIPVGAFFFTVAGIWLDFKPNWTAVIVGGLMCIPMAASIAVGTIYWRKAYTIGERMVSPDTTAITSLPITVNDVKIIAFSTVGILFVGNGVRQLVAFVLTYQLDFYTARQVLLHPDLWASASELGVGLWLVLGSRGIVGFIEWVRIAGCPELQDGATADSRPDTSRRESEEAS